MSESRIVSLKCLVLSVAVWLQNPRPDRERGAPGRNRSRSGYMLRYSREQQEANSVTRMMTDRQELKSNNSFFLK